MMVIKSLVCGSMMVRGGTWVVLGVSVHVRLPWHKSNSSLNLEPPQRGN